MCSVRNAVTVCFEKKNSSPSVIENRNKNKIFFCAWILGEVAFGSMIATIHNKHRQTKGNGIIQAIFTQQHSHNAAIETVQALNKFAF